MWSRLSGKTLTTGISVRPNSRFRQTVAEICLTGDETQLSSLALRINKASRVIVITTTLGAIDSEDASRFARELMAQELGITS